MITVAPGLVERTLGELRRCGAGRHECVVYWLADLERVRHAVDVIHPVHRAGPAWYEVDSGWLTGFGFELADRRQTAVAQVHTHPGTWIDHSETDDEFVLVPSPGFVSVVLPGHAAFGDPAAWAVHRLEPSGAWVPDARAIEW